MINITEPFGTSQEPIVVVPVAEDICSFGWGDFPVPTPNTFPIIYYEDVKMRGFLSPSLNFVEESILIGSSSEDDESASNASSVDSSMDDTVAVPPPMKKGDGRFVKFSAVQVREYDVDLGEHPFCSEYPLTLGWQYADTIDYNVDEYERQYRRSAGKAGLRRLTVAQRIERLLLVKEKSLQDLQKQEMERRRAAATLARQGEDRCPILPIHLHQHSVMLDASQPWHLFQTQQWRCGDI